MYLNIKLLFSQKMDEKICRNIINYKYIMLQGL